MISVHLLTLLFRPFFFLAYFPTTTSVDATPSLTSAHATPSPICFGPLAPGDAAQSKGQEDLDSFVLSVISNELNTWQWCCIGSPVVCTPYHLNVFTYISRLKPKFTTNCHWVLPLKNRHQIFNTASPSSSGSSGTDSSCTPISCSSKSTTAYASLIIHRTQ
jgi:hypothetical protein